ncbi:hypothetical protein DAPPUDRAFT_97932 [Daphnia pulex]|uniref:Uncharacterized protein n=1 Tax=Daphnia pulex TaxID=6669 RepID=E9G2Y6_DAPPU|nr:hypothetical protein DAPPUDRAFT_97932 [Daphnia pulex]|eukprot:EFX86122.1 hypothetical protein DAPPUDRAFT_97932 [Daphnia pulex]
MTWLLGIQHTYRIYSASSTGLTLRGPYQTNQHRRRPRHARGDLARCREKRCWPCQGGSQSGRSYPLTPLSSLIIHAGKLRRDMDKNGRNNNVNEILHSRRDCRPIVPNVVLPRSVLNDYSIVHLFLNLFTELYKYINDEQNISEESNSNMSRTEAVASVTPSDFVVDEMSEALIKRMHYPLFMMI